ncbi:Gfo/Idh/MocA family oxidoreductase [Rubellicoccus peritrichatus]|uniref:Gfo/Idh/MocA family oxidoreductase n=1 Tax=Rubellicoccus peritrichatus TaxID=3080537 RepID=A0AAQ3LG42_9BACT|nr:Gfo/Idh/MocA family oxidoreductase [Puniceicoccus sp. CR14]WOO43198.1 Gfo/Idh/MocA family oxidoreductase [Puniceicoccus sp. CR14]
MEIKREKVRAGLVGLNFGKLIIEEQIFNKPGSEFIELTSICDQDIELCEHLAKQYGVTAYYDLDELLEDDSIQAVILITGPSGRADLIRKIIRSGKDVMTTKPFEIDPVAAASVLEEARSLNRIIYLNSPSATNSRDFQIINRWREDYDLGMPVAGHHECWYKSIEDADGSWYDDPVRCPAAPILRLGIYGLNDMLKVFGEPESIQVMQTRLFTGRPTPDMARLSIKFKSGAIADTLDGWTISPERQSTSLTLYFENGTIYRNPTMMPCDPVRASIHDHTYLCLCTADNDDGMPVETIRLPNVELSQAYQWNVFHQAVTTRIRPIDETPDSVIVNSLRVIASLKEASETGGTVYLDPPLFRAS